MPYNVNLPYIDQESYLVQNKYEIQQSKNYNKYEDNINAPHTTINNQIDTNINESIDNFKMLKPENIKLINEITTLNKKIEKMSSVRKIKSVLSQRDDILEKYFRDIILSDTDPEQTELYYKIASNQAKSNSSKSKDLLNYSNHLQINPSLHKEGLEPFKEKEKQQNKSKIDIKSSNNDSNIDPSKNNIDETSKMILKDKNKGFIINTNQLNNQLPTQNKENETIQIDQKLILNTASSKNNQEDDIITENTENNNVENIRDNDLVNITQLNKVKNDINYVCSAAQNNNSRVNDIQYKLLKTNIKIKRAAATSAALTGLFQPYNIGKINITASIGGYDSAKAIAIGTGYRVDNNVAIKAGFACSNGNINMYNISFNLEW